MPDPDSRGNGPSIRVLEYTVPVLLSALALTQVYLGTQQWLTPWKGGGFGMFSTVDSPSGRSLRTYLVIEDGPEIPTREPRWLNARRLHARSLPADFRLRSMVDEMASAQWIYRKSDSRKRAKEDEAPADPTKVRDTESMDGSGVVAKSDSEQMAPDPAFGITPEMTKRNPYPKVKSILPGNSIGDYEPVKVKAVRLEVWRQVFDFDTTVVSQEKIKEVVAEVPES